MKMGLSKDLSVEVVRTTRRKTATIKIVDGATRVIVPNHLSDARIAELVNKRTSWIRQKLREQSEAPSTKPKEYVNGESFCYLGRNYRLKVLQNRNHEVKLHGGYLEVGVTQSVKEINIRRALVKWYVQHALDRLTEKTNRYAAIMGVSPHSITVKEYKARWGSCTSQGDISYNWRIVIAPHHIVDYVVVHELCHLKHQNHSPTYWKAVKRMIPDYKERRHWLKHHAAELMI